mgnify:CR=1 FL=1
MKQFRMEDARDFAVTQVKLMLARDGRLKIEYIQGINKMLEFLDSLPEEEEE